MLPDFLKKSFQISTFCPSGKSNMLMKEVVHKVTNAVLEYACNTDWPLGVSPCFEADSCSGSQEFSLSVMQPECSTLLPLSSKINFNIIVCAYKTNQSYSNNRLMKDRFQNRNPTRPIHGPCFLLFNRWKSRWIQAPSLFQWRRRIYFCSGTDPAHCYAQFYGVLKLPRVIVK
jgi:hypothetical protein